jgi:hypothetical protein
VLGLFEPNALLPAQYVEAMRCTPFLKGERRLALSVLRDAVRCFMANINSSTSKGQRLFHDAEQWITLEDKKMDILIRQLLRDVGSQSRVPAPRIARLEDLKFEAIERAHIARHAGYRAD